MKWNTDPDIVAGFLKDESGVTGSAQGVARPRTTQEVIELVKECAGRSLPLLPVGMQTATTGAAVPQEGIVCSLRSMSGVLDIDARNQTMDVLPGTLTAAAKNAAAQEGLYYPPDPTSEQECSIGGNVASNASGARTFRWGMTSRWIDGVEVVTGTGEVLWLSRVQVDKNTAGYGPFSDAVGLLCGSEGTLGVVTRVRLKLIQDPGPFVATMVFFPELSDALDAAVHFRSTRHLPGSPRCVELFDQTALSFLSEHSRPPSIPGLARAALYLEFDLLNRTLERFITEDLMPLIQFRGLIEDSLLADTPDTKTWIRELRHHIPETCNRLAAKAHPDGGLKVSTEFAVPPARFLEMMRFVEETALEHQVDLLVRYGHVGNAHPHLFTRGRDRDEVARLKRLSLLWVKHAVELGGTVSGEHGIGKTRRDFLPLMYSPSLIEVMRAVKRQFDPKGILAKGNLFPDTESMVPEYFA